MRKITILFLSMLLMVNFAYAGGLITNTNQSAAWSRMLVRDASTSIDAVYFNPAGLTKLADGFYISLSSQSIFQTQTLDAIPGLNRTEYVGKVTAPVFPDFYMAYKTGKWAFSFGFNVVGGGGGAEFKNGIPMDEAPIAVLVPQFASLGVTGYSVDAYLKGTSMYFGIQAGISYAITPNISFYVGGRYNIARNSYTGYLKNISFTTANGTVRANAFMKGVGDQFTFGAAGLTTLASSPASGYTLDQLVQGGYLSATDAANLEAGLSFLGATASQISTLSVSDLNTNFGSGFTAVAQQMYAGATLVADQNLDVKQKGTGFTPIIGANFSFLNDNLDIGIKYEFKTNMTLTNTTPAGEGFAIGLNPDGSTIEMFPNGGKTNADIPSYLSVGIRYNVSKVVSLQGGYHLYGDRGTGWTNVKDNVGNDYQEYGLGAEFNVTSKLLLSAGYLYSKSGVNQSYQSDLSYSLTAGTVGLGGAYKISDKVTLQLGGYLVSYKPKTYSETTSSGKSQVSYSETYKKSTWAIAAGLDFSFGKKHKK